MDGNQMEYISAETSCRNNKDVWRSGFVCRRIIGGEVMVHGLIAE